MSETKSIYSRLAAIMGELGAIGKNEKNQHQGWSFRGIDTIYQHTQKLFAKYEVIPGAEILSYTQEKITSAKGLQGYYMTAHVRVHFYSEGGSTFMDTLATSSDYSDKVGGQVMSMVMKKAIIDVLVIPANDADPDSKSVEMKPTPQIKWVSLKDDSFAKKLPELTKRWDGEIIADSEKGKGINVDGHYIFLTPAQFEILADSKL